MTERTANIEMHGRADAAAMEKARWAAVLAKPAPRINRKPVPFWVAFFR